MCPSYDEHSLLLFFLELLHAFLSFQSLNAGPLMQTEYVTHPRKGGGEIYPR
jgi:hypothetical protein